jgi:hypothetical protein
LTDVAVDELLPAFESLARGVMKQHEKRFQERIRAVRDAGKALENAASRLSAAVRNAWGTMDKSASEYGTRMAQNIEESVRKLSRQEISASYEEAERFHKDSVDALNAIIKTVRRYVPKLRRDLRVEMAALDVALGKLETAVRSLGLALDQSPGNTIELIRKDILHITQERAELMKHKADELAARQSLEANAVKERTALSETKEFLSKKIPLELARYEESLSAKAEEITQFLQPIMKPLMKLERSESNNKGQTVDLGLLRSLIDRPVETLLTGQPFALTELLNRLSEALRSGRLEIEERRRRKAEEAIQKAMEDGISRFREDYLTIQANVQETLRQLKVTGLLDKKNEIEQRQATIRAEKDDLLSRIAELRRRIEAITQTLMKQKQSLEQRVKQATSKSLEIQIA